MTTRSKSRKHIETQTEVEAQQSALAQPIEPTATGIMQNADLLAELQKQRDEIAILSQRVAASEERADNMSATLRWQQEQHHKDVSHLAEVVATEKQRLTQVKQHGERLFKTMRNQMREARSREIAYVESQEDEAGVQVQRDVDDDSQSTVSTLSRAEMMTQQLEDARSEVGSVVSHGPRFW